MTSDPPDHSIPVDTDFENELDNFITLQQQLQQPNTLTIHHLSQTITSFESSNSPSTTRENRAQQVFKRELSNTQFTSDPRTAQTFMDYLLHTNTEEFCQVSLPFFPQYTYFTITQILTTINQITLTKMHYFPHFHGPHTITSVTHCHSHYIIIQMIMNYVKLGYIISLQHFTKNSSQLSD